MGVKGWIFKVLRDAVALFGMALILFSVIAMSMMYKGEIMHFLQ